MLAFRIKASDMLPKRRTTNRGNFQEEKNAFEGGVVEREREEEG